MRALVLTLVLMRMICYELDNVFIKVHNFDSTPGGISYGDVMVNVLTGPNVVDNITPDPLNTFHASSSCSLPPFSPKRYN